MGVSLVQSIAALIVIIGLLYFVRPKFELFQVGISASGPPPEGVNEFQRLVNLEFTDYYRPIESGNLYLLTLLTKDAEFMAAVQQYLPPCPPQQDEATVLTSPPQFMVSSNTAGGWFYESGAAYAIRPASQIRVPKLDSDEVPQGTPCPRDPDALKLLAEMQWRYITRVAAKDIPGDMIPFYANSKKFGSTNSFRALPQNGALDYIYTLSQMILQGQAYLAKLANIGKNIDVEKIVANSKIEPFTNCCDEPGPQEIANMQIRAQQLRLYDANIRGLLDVWKKIETALRGKFDDLDKGFTEENMNKYNIDLGNIADAL